MSQTYKTYLILTLILLIGIFALGYIKLQGVFGGTTINLSINTTDLADGLVGHWTFDGKDLHENAVDRSGQGNTGYLTGFTSTTTVLGKIGQALEFDGSDDYVDIATISIPDNITVSVWINSNETSQSDGYFVAKSPVNSVWQLNQTGSSVRWRGGAAGGTTVCALPPIKLWHHIVGMQEGTVTKIFINGEKCVESTHTAITNGSGKISIGRRDAGEYFNGAIDDVRIYNRALSATEVKKLYELGGTTHINVSVNTTDLSNGLVGHWTFDGKNLHDNATDSSGQGNTGYLTNFTPTTTARGKIGQALEFDGADDYIVVIDDDSTDFGTGDFSFSAWIDPTTSALRQGIINKRGGGEDYIMWINPDGTLLTYLRDTSEAGTNYVSTSGDLNDGGWHHVVASFDRSADVSFYVDGILVNAVDITSKSGNNINPAAPLYIGNEANQRYFNGPIDDVRIYNRALSATEVKKLFELGGTTHINVSVNTTDLADGLVGHWTFDGKDLHDNAVDKSGQGNTGYLTNFTSTTTVRGKIGQALEFDGSNDYVDVGTGLDQNGEVTLSTWFKTTVETAAAELIANSDSGGTLSDYGLEVNRTAGKLGALWGGSIILTGNTVIAADTWNHAVMVRSGSTGDWTTTLYLDGVADGTTTTATNPNGTNEKTSIGRPGNFDGAYVNGTIDDVRIYNRALSSSEIDRLYKLGR